MAGKSLQQVASALRKARSPRILRAERITIPGAQPRPRFDPPEPTAPALGSPPAPEQQAVQTSQDGAVPPSPTASPVQLAHPVVFGFMATIGFALAWLSFYIILNVGALAGWITGALFIALGLDPAVRKLEKLGLPRPLGILVVVATIALSLAGLIFYAAPRIAQQAVSFINGFPQQFERFLESEVIVYLDQQFGVRHIVDEAVNDTFAKITQDSNAVATFFNSLVNAGSAVAQLITGTIIVLFLSLYFLASMPLMKAWFVRLTPASKREKVSYLTEKITASVGQYVLGQGIVALLNGSVALILMLLTGVPFPQLLTLFVVLLAFIPLVGGVTAGILVSLVALTNSVQTALWYALGYFVYLQIEAYFVSPRVMAKAVAVPAGVAVIAVAAGGALWGVLGALIAIPVAASLLILLKEVFVPRQDAH